MKTIVAFAWVLLLGLPTLAQAQDVDSYTEAQQWRLAKAQLVQSLESPIDNVRTQALKNAIIFATLYRDKIDLGKAVGALREVYEEDGGAQSKLALAALQAISNNRAAIYLARHVTAEETEEGRVVMASVLNDFYLARTGDAAATSASSPPSR